MSCMNDPGDEQIILEDCKRELICGGCIVAMVKISDGTYQCPKCKNTSKEF